MGQTRQYASHAEREAAYRRRRKEAVAAHLSRAGLPPLPVIPTMPAAPRWKAALESACMTLRMTAEEMESYYEERTPRWQEGERGESFQERLQALMELVSGLEELEL